MMRIERVTGPDAVLAAAELFDAPPQAAATARFLASPDHHLLLAYDADPADNADGADPAAVGMITGVETTHPDKGTEMFLYELSVAPRARRSGVGAALVRALADLAVQRGCYGMWVGVEPDNVAALATYRRAAADEESAFVLLNWNLLPR